MLVEHFLRIYGARHGVALLSVTVAARRELQAYGWPGNVRELEKAMSRGVILAGNRSMTAADFGITVQDDDVDDDDDGASPAMTRRQRETLRMASIAGVVCRADLKARFGISGEAARRELMALVAAGYLRRYGSRGGSRYSPA